MPYLCYFVINYDNENSAVETTDDSDEAEDFVDAKMDDAKNG